MAGAAADEGALLQHLHSAGEIADSFAYAGALGVEHQALVGLLKSLAADGLVELAPLTTNLLALTKEGEQVVAEGSPEWRLFDAVPSEGGATQDELTAKLGKEVVKVSQLRAVCYVTRRERSVNQGCVLCDSSRDRDVEEGQRGVCCLLHAGSTVLIG
jgi:DNA-binding MarR family transcriptional regulator